MAFISSEFLIFVVIVIAVHYALPYHARWAWLLAASLYFYGSSEPLFLIQILTATTVTYAIGLLIERTNHQSSKQSVLTIGLFLLVANLIAFKYTGFLNETLRQLFEFAGLIYPVTKLNILLPIGISFYTFLLVGYLIDVYRGTPAERHAGIFMLFVLFFPKVIAGPIERTKNLMPQLHTSHRFTCEQTVFGLQLILWGVFQKAVVADRILPFVNNVYSAPHAADGVMLTTATFLYAFQIYCDFSGYTNIALGVAAILGYKLIGNFNRPYFATSIADFWKRWHISLTSWLTDYVYTPLTRQRFLKIKFFTMMLVGLFLTFVISGFWHGAHWTYVIWGMLHGTYIILSLLLQKPRNNFVRMIGLNKRPNLHRAVKIGITFILVCYAYVWFRANSGADALYITSHLFIGWSDPISSLKRLVGLNQSGFILSLLGIAVVIAADILQGKAGSVGVGAILAARPAWMRWALYYASAVSILLIGVIYSNQQFIYFRF